MNSPLIPSPTWLLQLLLLLRKPPLRQNLQGHLRPSSILSYPESKEGEVAVVCRCSVMIEVLLLPMKVGVVVGVRLW